MYCSACKVMNINPVILPYGGYYCNEKHVLCEVCKIKFNGNCAVCWKPLTFLRLGLRPLPANDSHINDMSTAAVHNLLNNTTECKINPMSIESDTQSDILNEDHCNYSLEFMKHTVDKAKDLIKQIDLYVESSDDSKKNLRKSKNNTTTTIIAQSEVNTYSSERDSDFLLDDMSHCINNISVSEVRLMDPVESKSQHNHDLQRSRNTNEWDLQQQLPYCCCKLTGNMLRDLEI